MARLISLFDQLAFSAANFLIGLVLIRTYTPIEYAGYANGLLVSLAISGIYRMSFSVPVSLMGQDLFMKRVRAVPAQHALVVFPLLLISGLVVLFELFFGQRTLVYTTAFGVLACLALFMSIDIDRVVLYRFVGGSFRWLIPILTSGSVVFLVGVVYVIKPRFEIAMFGLMCISLAKLLIIAFKVGGYRWRHAIFLWRRMLKDSVRWNTFGALSAIGFTSAPQWVLGFFGGAYAVAGYAAVRLPLQPMMVLIRSLDVVDKLVFAKVFSESVELGKRKVIRSYLFYLLLSIFLGVLAVIWADEIISVVVGGKYTEFDKVFMLTVVSYILIASMPPLESVVYKIGMYKNYAMSQFFGALLSLIVTVPLVMKYSSEGAVIGGICGFLVPYSYLLFVFFKNIVTKERAEVIN
ncbi:hypothetical protein [Azonexus sp. R2A61]|uniref:hypothetical protein n=1 Tax=Azonexus sp. R2A61 TaxID=2744443 RepID=UPI001F33A33A|nr:hypothetical protein [Azonexus sp. R2A61]